jgi:arsenical pump membrane protein
MTIVVAAIFLATIVLVTLRPYGISEAWVACGGAGLMLLGGFVHPREAVAVLRSQWNVYGFFLGLMTIAAVADQAGFFDRLALGAARVARGSALRLYLAIFLIGTLITAVLSNDATALILTPVVYTLVTRLRLKVLPFMFACTFIADTASFLLPVSNPINILILSSFGGTLGAFLSHLLLPALLCITINIAGFAFLFRRDLQVTYDLSLLSEPAQSRSQQHFLRFVVGSLLLLTAG